MIYAIMILIYILILCVFGYAVAVKNEDVCAIIDDEEWWKVILWPLTILFWFVTKMHNLVHRDRG